MWQASGPRSRSSRKGRGKARIRNSLHLQRVSAEIRIAPRLGERAEVFTARLILNDFSPKGVGFFTRSPVGVGSDLALTLEHPKRIYLKAHVVWCQEVESTHAVISDQHHRYRVGVKFLFQSEEEEKAIQEFCDEVLRALAPFTSAGHGDDEAEPQAA